MKFDNNAFFVLYTFPLLLHKFLSFTLSLTLTNSSHIRLFVFVFLVVFIHLYYCCCWYDFFFLFCLYCVCVNLCFFSFVVAVEWNLTTLLICCFYNNCWVFFRTLLLLFISFSMTGIHNTISMYDYIKCMYVCLCLMFIISLANRWKRERML